MDARVGPNAMPTQLSFVRFSSRFMGFQAAADSWDNEVGPIEEFPAPIDAKKKKNRFRGSRRLILEDSCLAQRTGGRMVRVSNRYARTRGKEKTNGKGSTGCLHFQASLWPVPFFPFLSFPFLFS